MTTDEYTLSDGSRWRVHRHSDFSGNVIVELDGDEDETHIVVPGDLVLRLLGEALARTGIPLLPPRPEACGTCRPYCPCPCGCHP